MRTQIVAIKAILPKMCPYFLTIIASDEICADRYSAQGASDASHFGRHYNCDHRHVRGKQRRSEVGLVHRQVFPADVGRSRWLFAVRLARFNGPRQIYNAEWNLRSGAS